jgi:hypothetical protein
MILTGHSSVLSSTHKEAYQLSLTTLSQETTYFSQIDHIWGDDVRCWLLVKSGNTGSCGLAVLHHSPGERRFLAHLLSRCATRGQIKTPYQ